MTASEADEKRLVVELLCRRLVKADFKRGNVPRDPQAQTLREHYGQRLADELVTEEEWDEVCQVIMSWQDAEEQQARPVLDRILARFSRFPTIERVSEILGTDRAEAYRTALERIECDQGDVSRRFPPERSAYPWRKFDMDSAVSIVVSVIAPNIGDEIGMSAAYQQLTLELRARRKERSSMSAAEFAKRKAFVRSLGIWFPITKDIEAWKRDPRTRDIMPEFIETMNQVTGRMRMVRSMLQHIPRRRLSTRACADLPANLQRLKAYQRGHNIC